MRHVRVALAAAALLALAAAPASATWTDPVSLSGASLATTSLTAPTLACAETTGPLLSNAATISWTPSTSPTTLTYTATVVETGASLTVSANSSVQLYPSLLSTLFGTTVTIRVTGSLAGTGWSASSTRTVQVGLAGAYVNC